MKLFSLAEKLEILSNLIMQEGYALAQNQALHDQHEAAKVYANERGIPVQGVCPTMMRDLGVDNCSSKKKKYLKYFELSQQFRDYAEKRKE